MARKILSIAALGPILGALFLALSLGGGSARADGGPTFPIDPDVFEVVPCPHDFCPTDPDPDPDPDPQVNPDLFGPDDLSICPMWQLLAGLCDDPEPDPEVNPDLPPMPGDVTICPPWKLLAGLCGDDDDGPGGFLPDLDITLPEPDCVQIHEEFPCPEDDDDPEVPDGFCKLVLGEDEGPKDPDCPDDEEPGDDTPVVPEDKDPGNDPEDPGNDPEDPGNDPEDPGNDPENPSNEPKDPGNEPEDPGNDPENPGNEPEAQDDNPQDDPVDQPDESDDPLQVGDEAPIAPDAGGGTGFAGGFGNQIYLALALVAAGGILGGFAFATAKR